MNDYSVYIVAGIATSPNYFTNLCTALKHFYFELSKTIDIHTLYPYGDWSANIPAQVNRVLKDSRFSYKSADRSYGAQQTRRFILDHYDSGEIVILGHSGGGRFRNSSRKLGRNEQICIPYTLLGSL